MIKQNIKYSKTLIICCCLIASSVGISINTSGVFYSAISESLGLLQGKVSISGSLLMIFSAVTTLLIPKVMAKIQIKHMVLVAAIAAFLSTVLIPIFPHPIALYVFSSIRGIAISFYMVVPITILMNYWFLKKYGLFTSIVLGCSGITSAVASPFLVTIIHNFGWEYAYIMMGILQILLCLPAIFCKFTLTPQEQGIKPYGAAGSAEEVFHHAQNKQKNTCIEKGVLKKFLLFLLFSSLITAITGVCQHFTSISEQSNMPYTVTAFVMTAVMLGNITFKFLIGIISDRIGAASASMLMIFINILAVMCITVVHLPILYLIGTYLFGAIYSISAVGIVLLMKDLFGVGLYNKLYPIVSFSSNIAMAISLSCVGFLYDFTGNYYSVFILVILLQCFNLLFLYRNKGKKMCVVLEKS